MPGREPETGPIPPQAASFATTLWNVVRLAGQRQAAGSEAALEQLCRRYWPPIYAFIRHRGHLPAEAQDLTQEFFARLLEKNSIQSADATRGRFRTFLLTAVTRFLINERARARAQKRGGGQVHFSLDDPRAEGGCRIEPADPATPEIVFARRWAETVLETVLGRLQRELEDAGQGERFALLKPLIAAEGQAPSTPEIAARLGVTEGTVYAAVHRLRRRYGEILREEITHTVNGPEEVEEELRCLVRALSG